MTINTQFETELKKLLHARMVEIAEILTEGQAVRCHENYQRYVGEFQAFKCVVDTYCDEVNTVLNQR